MNEQYRLIVQPYEEGETTWLIELNIHDIWEKFDNNNITQQQFLEDYRNYLISNKNSIIEKTGQKSWNDLIVVLNNFNKKDMDDVINEIYDWGDKYGVKISA